MVYNKEVRKPVVQPEQLAGGAGVGVQHILGRVLGTVAAGGLRYLPCDRAGVKLCDKDSK